MTLRETKKATECIIGFKSISVFPVWITLFVSIYIYLYIFSPQCLFLYFFFSSFFFTIYFQLKHQKLFAKYGYCDYNF